MKRPLHPKKTTGQSGRFKTLRRDKDGDFLNFDCFLRDFGSYHVKSAGTFGVAIFGSKVSYLIRQRSFQIALVLWVFISLTAVALCHGTMPLPIGPHPGLPSAMVIFSSIALVFLVLEIGLVALITRRRPIPDLAERAPERGVALRETLLLWIYGVVVLLAARVIGLHFFGEGIALHLNGSLVGATRLQSPREVYTWAAYNGIFFALIPLCGVPATRLFARADEFEVLELEKRRYCDFRGNGRRMLYGFGARRDFFEADAPPASRRRLAIVDLHHLAISYAAF
jgi:hypothetical protein